jgi:hypothetical protein
MQLHRQIHLFQQTAYRNNEDQFRGLEEVGVDHQPVPKRMKCSRRISLWLARGTAWNHERRET